MKSLAIVLILGAGMSTLAAQNQDRPRGNAQDRGPRGDPATLFDQIDADKDSLIDLKELTDFRANMPMGPRGNRPNAAPDSENSDNAAPVPPPRANRGPGGPGGRGPQAMVSPEEMIKNHDKDADEKLSREEFGSAFQRLGRGPREGQGAGPGQRAKRPE